MPAKQIYIYIYVSPIEPLRPTSAEKRITVYAICEHAPDQSCHAVLAAGAETLRRQEL